MLEFNPLDYDIYHIGISGGKDSTAAYCWLKYESGWPQERIRATFCDTGNEDYYTYTFIKMLSEKVHPIEVIYPEMDFWELAKFKTRFPSRKGRFCTQWLKVIPSREDVLNLQRQGTDPIGYDSDAEKFLRIAMIETLPIQAAYSAARQARFGKDGKG